MKRKEEKTEAKMFFNKLSALPSLTHKRLDLLLIRIKEDLEAS